MANGLFDRPAPQGSFRAAFGAPTFEQERERRASDMKRQQLRMALMESALEVLPVGDRRRDAIEAQMMQLTGGGQEMAGAITAIRPTAKAPEGFTLGRGQRRFQTDPAGGPARLVAEGVPFPEVGAAESTAALRTREQKIRDQMDLNLLSRAQATDVVDGNKVVTRPDKFGNVYLVNRATSDAELVSGKGPGGPSARTAQPVQPGMEAPPMMGMQPEEAARAGTGPVARTLQGVSNMFGFMFAGQIAPQTIEARQTLNLFNKTMERSLVNNPRFPVAEQEFVRSLMPNTAEFFSDPDDAVAKVRQLQSYLKNQLNIKQQELLAPGLTSARKAALSDQVSGLREIARMFPQGGDPGRFGSMSTEQLSNVDIDSLSPEEMEAYDAALNEVPRF